MTVDWSRPIEGVPVAGGDPIHVSVDRTYHRSPNRTPVRFPVNLWTGQTDGYYVGGTWYFTDDGKSVGGCDASGKDNSKFLVRNKP